MKQRLILTEEEKRNIQEMYGLITEQTKSDTSCQLLSLINQEGSLSNIFKSESGEEGCKIYRGVLEKEIIPNLTEDIIKEVEREINGNLIEVLSNKGVPCSSLLKIFEKFPSDSNAIGLSKNTKCHSSGAYLYVAQNSPSKFLQYVRSVYGKHLSNIVNNPNIDEVIKKVFQIVNTVNDSSYLNRAISQFGEQKIVDAVNNIEDEGLRKEVVMMFKVLYHHLGFDSLSGYKLQGLI